MRGGHEDTWVVIVDRVITAKSDVRSTRLFVRDLHLLFFTGTGEHGTLASCVLTNRAVYFAAAADQGNWPISCGVKLLNWSLAEERMFRPGLHRKVHQNGKQWSEWE
jgi:hypothetical protein